MKGVVLAAGEGTRLRPLTDDKPKPLVEVAGVPILERCFNHLMNLGVDGFVVVVGYKKEKIIEKYGSEYEGIPVNYAHQNERKGLAHALIQAEPHIEDDFLLVHGDNVFGDSAYSNLKEVVLSEGDATLLVEDVSEERARNSAVVVAEDGRVVDVVERSDNPPSTASVAGFYKLPPAVFDACRHTDTSERGEYELGDALSSLAQSHDMRAVFLEGSRVNINHPSDIEETEEVLRDK